MVAHVALRNTFSEDMSDAFDIMWGNHGLRALFQSEVYQFKFGVVDLLILPLIAHWMINFGFPSKPLAHSTTRVAADLDKRNWFRTTVGVTGLLLQVPSLLVALLLTFAATPFVVIVHAVKFFHVRSLTKRFYQLEGREYDSNYGVVVNNEKLEDYVNETEASLDNLSD